MKIKKNQNIDEKKKIKIQMKIKKNQIIDEKKKIKFIDENKRQI